MTRKKSGDGTGAPVEAVLPSLDPEPGTAISSDGARDALEGSRSPDPEPSDHQDPGNPPPAPEPPKRKRGRPRGSRTRSDREPGVVGEIRPGTNAALQERIRELEAQVPSNLELVTKALEGTFGMVSIMLVRAFGEAAQLTRGEQKQLAECWATPLAPYLDTDTAKYLPWLTALGVTYSIAEPKYRAIQQQRALQSGEEIVVTGSSPDLSPAPAPEVEATP